MYPLRVLTLSGVLLACSFAALGQAPTVPPPNLIANGSFEELKGGWAVSWQKNSGASIAEAAGKHWLRLSGAGATSAQRVELKPEWWMLRLTLRMKSTDVVLGDDSWKNARLAMSFHAADGTRVGNWPNVFNAVGSTEWTVCDREYGVPRGAVYLSLNPANFGTGGSVEFDDLCLVVTKERALTKTDAALPEGVGDPWAAADAWQVDTGTQGRLCLNGLWAFRPVVEAVDAQAIPAAGDCWGWFKVPGIWPWSSWSAGQSAQVVHLSPWIAEGFESSGIDQAWQKRRLSVPAAWSGRRLWLEFTMLQTHAAVFVDGQRQGEVWFPGGRLEMTAALRPGATHELAVLVTARPLESDAQVFMAPDRVVKNKATVKLKGITGDVFLVSGPTADVVRDVRLTPSVQEGSLGIEVGVEAPRSARYRLAAEISRDGAVLQRFASGPLAVVAGRIGFVAPWAGAPLWDTDRPEGLLSAAVTLLDEAGKELDRAEPVRFGFREVRIVGRDILLNGTPVHLRALHNISSNGAADQASRAGAREMLRRMRQYGFNFMIQGNYDFTPGEVGYVDGLLEACDEAGMLLSISLPHVKDFGWKLDDPAQAARYRAQCEWIIRRVQNHPSVIMYAMNHNATGYYGDQNPQKMDGIYSPDALTDSLDYKGDRGRLRRRAQAQLAADLARDVDPTRPIYHHQSGNLGDLHTVNIYLNWAPQQERSDWLAHWGTVGRKPMFFVEWGLPHISSWSSYRGPEFIWRCLAFQSAWVPEFAAAYLGSAAYQVSPGLRKVFDYEEELWAKGQPFYWSSLAGRLREDDAMHTQVMALFAADNWRSHRAWGISAMLPWDQEHLWKRLEPTPNREIVDRYRNLQRPGIVPDFATASGQYIYDGGEESHYAPTALGECFQRWNMPLCAFIGGRTDGHRDGAPSEDSDRRFTEKRHTVLPGETLLKSLVILNDTRQPRPCAYRWRLAVPGGASGQGSVTVEPGGRAFVPIAVPIAATSAAGPARLTAEFDFGDGQTQRDEFGLDVLPTAAPTGPARPVWLLDPEGTTAAYLDRLGARHQPCTAAGDGVRPGDVVVVGEGALSSPDLAAAALPVLARAVAGARVLVLAQDSEVLTQRLGFRVNVQGLRQLFRRAPGHPVLAGFTEAEFANWAGSAGTVPPYLDVPAVEERDPQWSWCGFRNTRVWRCGTLGSVASVLIEKPSRGDWLPLLDGGFDLQYAPLLETAVGAGRIVFCQLDVVRRSEPEPVADRVVTRLLAYLETAPSRVTRPVLYCGDERGRAVLTALGVAFGPGPDQVLTPGALLVAGPGSVPPKGALEAVAAGGALLCLGLNAAELAAWLPEGPAATDQKAEARPLGETLPEVFAGLSEAELQWRTRPLIGALQGPGHPALRVVRLGQGLVVLCQAAPWAFDAAAKPYLRTTARRSEFLLARLLANLGAAFSNPVAANLAAVPVASESVLPATWVGIEDPQQVGREQQWWQPQFEASAWPAIVVPGTFEAQRPALAKYDGWFWYRLKFTTAVGFAGADATLSLGGIDDESWVWLNGEFLGEVTKATNPKDYWQFPREYRLREGLLRASGENVIAVLVNDTYQTGGILGQPILRRPALWLKSYYVQAPLAGDDPYRYYRW
jgi:hypothetical protein